MGFVREGRFALIERSRLSSLDKDDIQCSAVKQRNRINCLQWIMGDRRVRNSILRGTGIDRIKFNRDSSHCLRVNCT